VWAFHLGLGGLPNDFGSCVPRPRGIVLDNGFDIIFILICPEGEIDLN
jgi:hypothetical protein